MPTLVSVCRYPDRELLRLLRSVEGQTERPITGEPGHVLLEPGTQKVSFL